MKRLIHLKNKSGSWFLLLFRLPFRLLNVFVRVLSTFFWKMFLNNMGKNSVIESGVKFEKPRDISIGKGVYIGKNCVFNSEFLDSQLIIEDNVQINENCRIDYSGNVIIKKSTVLSANVVFFSHSHGYSPRNKAIKKPLIIGEKCWIGYGTTLLENVDSIADNILIGANSTVVSSCLESKSIYAGIPAKKIKNVQIG